MAGYVLTLIICIIYQKADVKLLSTKKDEKDLINNYGFPFNNKLLNYIYNLTIVKRQ